MLRAAISVTVIALIYRFVLPGPQFIGIFSNIYLLFVLALGTIVGFSAIRWFSPSERQLSIGQKSRTFLFLFIVGCGLFVLVITHNWHFWSKDFEGPEDKYIFFSSLFIAAAISSFMTEAFSKLRKK